MLKNEGLSEQVIIAQCTPKGSGAIALLRLSGKNVRKLAHSISQIPGKSSILSTPSHTIIYGWIVDSLGNKIDQVLFLIMDGPRTFTGQNTVEITCHNNPFIIESIINAAINQGARLAGSGEFSRRAVENNKIDLLQAEAINELIHANNQAAIKQSLAQIEGSFSSFLVDIETKLVRALAFCQASFEFLDEEEEFGHIIKKDLEDLLKIIAQLKNTFNIQNQIRNGIRIALIGSVNAGKSSIFNALLNQERAIVTNIAGTTRDVIEAGMYKGGNYWTLIDTAGLRKTNDIIEKEGIAKSLKEADAADIILLVFDSSRELTSQEQEVYEKIANKHSNKIITLKNKADLTEKLNYEMKTDRVLKISAQTKEAIDQLESHIEEKIKQLLEKADAPFLVNKRHYTYLLSMEKELATIIDMLATNPQYELIAYHLNLALENISQLTGKTVSEIGMDAVFKEFCVGK